MLVTVLKSKLHKATVTGGHVDYEGSLTIDQEFMERVGILPYEKVLVGNMANGARFETYVIVGERGKKEIVLNGATAHLGKPGDRLTIMTFAQMPLAEAESFQPRKINLDAQNNIVG
ncbi:aspartate 1-decarboxylase [Kamptonema cortianum]|nr:aspartate 1-decarboxylase [Kamptonema cortianum]MDL5050043.1 aspartate 1-decarboxylase [Oscillatoria amoena NRMC-F 0135]